MAHKVNRLGHRQWTDNHKAFVAMLYDCTVIMLCKIQIQIDKWAGVSIRQHCCTLIQMTPKIWHGMLSFPVCVNVSDSSLWTPLSQVASWMTRCHSDVNLSCESTSCGTDCFPFLATSAYIRPLQHDSSLIYCFVLVPLYLHHSKVFM